MDSLQLALSLWLQCVHSTVDYCFALRFEWASIRQRAGLVQFNASFQCSRAGAGCGAAVVLARRVTLEQFMFIEQ